MLNTLTIIASFDREYNDYGVNFHILERPFETLDKSDWMEITKTIKTVVLRACERTREATNG